MPEDVRSHIAHCAVCRTFITRWNSIELRLIALREEAPELQRDLAPSIRAGVLQPRPPIRLQFLPRRRLALAGALACIPILLAAFAVYAFLHRSSSNLASRNGGYQHNAAENNLPLAHTGR